MTDKIRAPWTAEQVTALNAFQHRSGMHPFTCGGEHASGPSPVLVATHSGWVCPDPQCVYRQDWAHAFMADPEAWPVSPWAAEGCHGPTPEEMRAGEYARKVNAPMSEQAVAALRERLASGDVPRRKVRAAPAPAEDLSGYYAPDPPIGCALPEPAPDTGPSPCDSEGHLLCSNCYNPQAERHQRYAAAIRDRIKACTTQSPIFGQPPTSGATEHDIARAVMDVADEELRELRAERDQYASAIRHLLQTVRHTAYVWSQTLPETIRTADVVKALSGVASHVPPPPEGLRDDLWQRIVGAYYARFESDGHPEDSQTAADVAMAIVKPELDELRAEVERLKGELQEQIDAKVGVAGEWGNALADKTAAEATVARVAAVRDKWRDRLLASQAHEIVGELSAALEGQQQEASQ